MKYIYFLISLVAIYIVYGLMISQINLKYQASPLSFDKNKPFNDYKGVINVHSKMGDGQGTIPEILQAAYLSKLDFIIFTESNVYSKKITPSSYAGDLLVLHGREYSYLKSRLILIDPDLKFENIKSAASAQLFISDLLEQDHEAFIILNHPTKPGYEWEGDYSPNIDALEIINLRSNWSAAWAQSKLNFLRSLLIYPFNADYAFLNLFQPPIENLKLWVQLIEQSDTVGLLGSDAKSKLRIYDKTYLKFPSYKKLFSLGTNHVFLKSELTGNVIADTEKVLSAIKKGSLYISLDFVGDSRGFQFYAKNKSGTHSLGSHVSIGSELCIQLPQMDENITGRIFLNGEKYLDVKKDTCIDATQKGAYNIILQKKIQRSWPFRRMKIPWVITNFIYVK